MIPLPQPREAKARPDVCRFPRLVWSGALRPKLASPVSRQGSGTLRALTYVPCTGARYCAEMYLPTSLRQVRKSCRLPQSSSSAAVEKYLAVNERFGRAEATVVTLQ